MSQIQIICSKPGIRRNGIEHPASAVYSSDRWTPAQLQAFQEDPAFIVQEVATGGVRLSGSDFDNAVAAAVTLQVQEKATELQATFNEKVEEAANERLAAAKAAHDNAIDGLGKKLDKANDRIKELEVAAKKDADTIKTHVATIADMKKTIAGTGNAGNK
ncbi:seryl-tRNA synthetase [Agrobacterium larrymoorei]|uniref:Seryl-tRNA synthetase n=1 Tax=Agrobacterium larrymoorei TaxID=160699 RepID=A0AAJ2ES39_9HYPH|nr:hypothetical protein [Agrobacterium larrymoorei]MDR6102790.1 seryl-tRNA synthetase [Agrobacterium larrymoorei]